MTYKLELFLVIQKKAYKYKIIQKKNYGLLILDSSFFTLN